jgi:hypothetical protein
MIWLDPYSRDAGQMLKHLREVYPHRLQVWPRLAFKRLETQ